MEKNKLVIVMVGLPGRGKTFLCNKLKCYLNCGWRCGGGDVHVMQAPGRRAWAPTPCARLLHTLHPRI